MMGQFKVGDRVRRVKPSMRPERYGKPGEVYTVLGVDSHGICVVEGCGTADPDKFELVAPSFAIGDRVYAKNRGFTTGEHEGVVFKIDDSVGVEYDGWTEGHDAGLGGPDNKWWHHFDEVRLVPKLQVQAGKSYRTRDGNKVSSVSRNGENGGHFYWTGIAELEGFRPFWCQDGKFYERGEHRLDLVAEWIDEPAVAPSNDNEPAASKFKVGDRVRVTHTDYPDHIAVGSFNAVIGVDEHGVDLECDGFDGGLYFWGHEVELATRRPAIVALIENGQPKPATRPFVHASTTAAAAEADRLASKHKGQIFGVYELVDQKQVERPSYPHEWQRLAADGQKINAIKTLRAVTGLGLKASKDAVEHWLAHDEPYSREYAARAA